MAVKQNNTEANGTPSSVGSNGNTTTSGSGKPNTVGGATAKKMNSGTDGATGGGGVGGNTDQAGCSINANGVNNKNNNATSIGIGSNGQLIANILHLIDLVEQKQQQVVISSQELVKIYNHILYELSRVKVPRHSEDWSSFKEDIGKVGIFFAKTNEKRVYFFCLNIVCKMITQTGTEAPSCAIAIIFQLFNDEMILEAVQSLLDQNIPDQNIKQTVRLLREWLIICNFCTNLTLWIRAILTGLREQQKFALFDEIAFENIDHLFMSLVLPALRPKVAPVVFHMLAWIHQSPEIFHKILPKIPPVINFLKLQANSNDIYAEDTKKLLQQLVDLTSALMVRFYGYGDLYEPVELALKDFQPSYNYLNYASSGVRREDDNYDVMLPNNTNAKVGLVNLGNTCYMNSVLQALAMTKEFSREILLTESKSPLLIKMQQQIALMHYSARFELTPSRVLNATRPPGFSPGLQQDSSEFLGYLLETLHEQEVIFQRKFNMELEAIESISKAAKLMENSTDIITNIVETQQTLTSAQGAMALNTTAAGDSNINVNNSNIIISTSASDIHKTPTKGVNAQTTVAKNAAQPTNNYNNIQKQMSTIDKTFTGKLATTYKCLTCGWQSRNIDSFRDLQLSFPEVKNDCSASNYSVQDLIDYYCSPEKLDGENQYFCERCKKLSDAERYINVINAPKNLILTLKHFKYDQKYHMRAKLMHKVFHDEKVSVKVCSTETLDEIASVHYDLYAGVVHSGFSMDSGHYYTYAADSTNKWYKFNDSIVTPSKSEELHNLAPPNTPYILFYQMGARSNETPEAAASTKVIKVDVPLPLTLDELPRDLRDYVNHDNYAFNEELKLRHFKQGTNMVPVKRNSGRGDGRARDGYDDDDDEQPPPASGCGGNTMNMNVNRFVY